MFYWLSLQKYKSFICFEPSACCGIEPAVHRKHRLDDILVSVRERQVLPLLCLRACVHRMFDTLGTLHTTLSCVCHSVS